MRIICPDSVGENNMIEHSIYQEFLLDFPMHFYAKNMAGEFIFCNKNQVISAGLADEKSMLGKTDFDMPWKKEATMLRKFDKLVIEKNQAITAEELSTLSDGSTARFLSHKKPYYQSNMIIGVIGASFQLEINSTNRNSNNPLYFDARTNKPLHLSKKQTICLRLLLEGKTAKNIAKETKNSFRTIQHHLDSIRAKNNFCSLKELLISVKQV